MQCTQTQGHNEAHFYDHKSWSNDQTPNNVRHKHSITDGMRNLSQYLYGFLRACCVFKKSSIAELCSPGGEIRAW